MTLENMVRRIKESAAKMETHSIYGEVLVWQKDPLPREIDLRSILKDIEKLIPRHLVVSVDQIIFGHFPELVSKEISASYADGAIYITNEQDEPEGIMRDIIHELAHAIEHIVGSDIYGDGLIGREFAGKRDRLYGVLKYEGFGVQRSMFLDLEYNEGFDNLLHKEVGYDTIGALASDLFITPYAATSIREYFACNFEEYYMGRRRDVAKLSPRVFSVLETINERKN